MPENVSVNGSFCRANSLDNLASSDVGFYPPKTMQKMSAIILALAEKLLAQPTENTSSEGAAAALLLAHVAWNRAVDPLGGDQIG